LFFKIIIGPVGPENEGIMIFRNVEKYSSIDTELHPKIPES